MKDVTFTVFLVDDDAGVVKALSRLLRAKGYNVRPFTSAQEFLDGHVATIAGCAVFDVAMPGLDGLALQEIFNASGNQRPIIFLTGKGDIPKSVHAMRAGAIDFLTKPVDEKNLLMPFPVPKRGMLEHVKLETKWQRWRPRSRP